MLVSGQIVVSFSCGHMHLGVRVVTGTIDFGLPPPRTPKIAVWPMTYEMVAHDLAGTVDPIGRGAVRAGDIDRRKRPSGIPQKAVGNAAAVLEGAHDLADTVDSMGLGAGRAGDIDCIERPSGIPQKAVGDAPGVHEVAHDLAGTAD